MLTFLCFVLFSGATQQAPLPDLPKPSPAAVDRAEAASRANGPRPSPVLIYQVNPDFPEKAREKHLSGTVEISLVVDEKGIPQNLVVTHGVGSGMDEEAVAAVRQYRFKPALAPDGTPVRAKTSVNVSFQMY